MTPKRQRQRQHNLLPDGVPRNIRVYDNGGTTVDRYTVVFTGRIPGKPPLRQYHVGMSRNPFHPQGFGLFDDHPEPIDRPTYGHLGRKIRFQDLPEPCKRCVTQHYCDLWNLPWPDWLAR